MPEIQLVIMGKVQGVCFRAEAQEKAQELGLTGWVKNQGDGSVLCVAQGPEGALDQLIEWSKKGPERANVEHVEIIRTKNPHTLYRDFEIIF